MKNDTEEMRPLRHASWYPVLLRFLAIILENLDSRSEGNDFSS
jgi:hypothetical protein